MPGRAGAGSGLEARAGDGVHHIDGGDGAEQGQSEGLQSGPLGATAADQVSGGPQYDSGA